MRVIDLQHVARQLVVGENQLAGKAKLVIPKRPVVSVPEDLIFEDLLEDTWSSQRYIPGDLRGPSFQAQN